MVPSLFERLFFRSFWILARLSQSESVGGLPKYPLDGIQQNDGEYARDTHFHIQVLGDQQAGGACVTHIFLTKTHTATA